MATTRRKRIAGRIASFHKLNLIPMIRQNKGNAEQFGKDPNIVVADQRYGNKENRQRLANRKIEHAFKQTPPQMNATKKRKTPGLRSRTGKRRAITLTGHPFYDGVINYYFYENA
jgi:hypothetical protein